MTEEGKRKSLLFIFLALVATLLIGAALPRLDLQPGLPPPSFDRGQVVVIPGDSELPVGVPINTFFLDLLLIITTILLLYVLFRIMKGANVREIVSNTIKIGVPFLIVVGLCYLIFSKLSLAPVTISTVPLPMPQPVITAPVGPVPTSLIWVVAIFLAVLVILLGVWTLTLRKKPAPELWAFEAESARDAILAGQELRSVIITCYRRVSQALQDEQQIERETSMTASEFERLLSAKGIPEAPIHQLTQLFEAVRYSRWQPDSAAEQNAIHCLDAILEYSRHHRQASQA